MRRLWRFRTGDAIRSAIVIADKTVYAGSDDSHLYAIDLESGKRKWSFKCSGLIYAGALAAGDFVYIGDEYGMVYALSKPDGRPVWRFETDGQISGLSRLSDSRILASSHDGFLYCLGAKTGKKAWDFETEDYVNAPATVAGDLIVFGGCDGLLRILSPSGKRIKEIDLLDMIPGTVPVVDGQAFVATMGGTILCIEVPEGTVVWKNELEQEEFVYSYPAVGTEYLVIGGRSGRLHCLDLETGRAPASLSKPFQTKDPLDCPVVLRGSRAIVGSDDGRIYVVDPRTGKKIWSYRIGREILSLPAVAHGRIVVGATDGAVYCFEEE